MVDSAIQERLPDSDEGSEAANTALSAILHKLAFEDLPFFDKNLFAEDDSCSCEPCKERRTMVTETLEELKLIHSYWVELGQYIRIVYRLSMKGSLKSIDEEYRNYMKGVVAKLCEVCNPHQLYQRLEVQVRELVVEVKVRLLQLMDRLAENPQLPKLFISGMLDRYNKMMTAAIELSPVLNQFEREHLSRFNLTWKILNQRLFQTSIYTDLFFQNSVPHFITQLGKSNESEENKKLVREFLSFDHEITLVEGLWSDVEARIKLYTQNQMTSMAKQRFLKDNWHDLKSMPRDQEKICYKHAKAIEEYLSTADVDLSECVDIDTASLPDACECHICVESAAPPVDVLGSLPFNLGRYTLFARLLGIEGGDDKEMHNGNVKNMDSPSASPQGSKKSDNVKKKSWPGSLNKSTCKVNRVNHLLSLGKSQPFKRKADKATQKDQDSQNQCDPVEKPEVSKTDCSDIRKQKECSTPVASEQLPRALPHCAKYTESGKRTPCSEQHSMKNMLHDEESGHNDCSSQDSRPCDCCYCEVFGHGLPTSAPMSRNYQEMRERLRLLLSKKKSKCKSSNAVNTPQPTTKKPQQASRQTAKGKEKDTRALEDLLDFIEGTEVKCRNEKKAAKKARQKEKKRKEEEEERARILAEEEEKKRREEELLAMAKQMERLSVAGSSKKKKNKNKNEKTTQMTNGTGKPNSSNSNSGAKMVTIKRIMEPHNSEPTVTITLRGATPKQDRVLYTFLNGQVCKVKPPESVPTATYKSIKELNPKLSPLATITPVINGNAGEKGKQKKGPFKPETTPAPPKTRIPKETPLPGSIQINNAVNSFSKNHSTNFNINDIKLPPGITITKVDPSTIQTRHSGKDNKGSTNPAPLVKTPNTSEVIVVSTNKLKQQNQAQEPPKLQNASSGKKKNKNNKKKENDTVLIKSKNSTYPGLDIEPITRLSGGTKDLSSQMSVLTINPYMNRSAPLESKQEGVKKKKKKNKKSQNTGAMNHDEWKLLDSVFAPKDLDLNDGEIDDAERELEAFKLFCLQSVPPKRKEKVNLNIKDIVLKKKSPISCV